MADLQAVIEAVNELNASELKQLYDYILQTRIQFIDIPQAPSRILGLHEHLGHAWMSDDFNDELPQEFWLGED